MIRFACALLAALLLAGCGAAVPEVDDRVHTFYYAWYGNPEHDDQYHHWNHRILPHWSDHTWDDAGSFPGGDDIGANFYPALGCYSSTDEETITRHLEMIQAAGIGVLVMTWWGKGSFEDRSLRTYLDLAERHGLEMAIHVEPFYKTAEELREQLEYLTAGYGAHPALYRPDGRPFYYVYDSYKLPLAEWKRLLTDTGDLTVRGTTLDATFIGLWVKEDEGAFFRESGFDGFYTYFAVDGFVYGSTPANWGTLSAFAEEHDLRFIPCVGPGYSDTRIRPWNRRNTRARDGGTYYERMFKAAVAVQPDAIGITSFNEWHEGTQIEPAVPHQAGDFTYEDYGDGVDPWFYLHRTRELIRTLEER